PVKMYPKIPRTIKKCFDGSVRHEELPHLSTYIIDTGTASCPATPAEVCGLSSTLFPHFQGLEDMQWICTHDVEMLRSGEIIYDDLSTAIDSPFLLPYTAEGQEQQKRIVEALGLDHAKRLIKNLAKFRYAPVRRNVSVAVLSTNEFEYDNPDLIGKDFSRYTALRESSTVKKISSHSTAILSIVDGVATTLDSSGFLNYVA
ncbi:hypothetical protein FOL47_004483, partial [Perkinsus chesapeaki]